VECNKSNSKLEREKKLFTDESDSARPNEASNFATSLRIFRRPKGRPKDRRTVGLQAEGTRESRQEADRRGALVSSCSDILHGKTIKTTENRARAVDNQRYS
jgi:hypothetical protein